MIESLGNYESRIASLEYEIRPKDSGLLLDIPVIHYGNGGW